MASTISYNDQQYAISDLQYPEDLGESEQYGKNKVVFLINVTSESRIRKNQNSNSVRDIPESEYKVSAKRELADKALSAISGVKDLPQEIKVLGRMKRLTSAISLYIPNDLNMGYNVEYGEEDLATSELAAQAALGVEKAIADKRAFSGSAGAVASAILTKAASSALSNNQFLQKALRATPGNAKAEQLFKRVEFRTFSFNYSFAPKSKEEARKVLNIIRTFRHHMLPEYVNEDQFIYVYPSEFEVKYYKNDKENEFLEKHFTAVLTSCNINYTPNGQFVTLNSNVSEGNPDGDTPGMPAQINMALTFKELALPSKETSPDNKPGT